MKRREFILKSTFTALVASVIPTDLLDIASAREQQMTLIDPTIHPRVLVAANASKSEIYAAKELITYLEKITGQKMQVEQTDEKPTASAQIPIIVIGSHPLNDALAAQISTMEETIIEAKSGILHLAGGKPVITEMPNGTQYVEDRGALYAVYNFLDELGVRWYRPEPWGEHVPQTPDLKVLLGRRQYKPVYSWRMGFDEYWPKPDETPANAMGRMWEIRNRQNVVTGASEEEGNSRMVLAWHSYPNLFPAAQYFAEHPEYYALIDGVRRKDGQLCVGNLDVQRLTAEKVLAYSQANPEYETYSLEPGDTGLWCQCELCKALDDPNQKMIWSDFTINAENSMGDISMSNRVCAFGKIVADKVAESNQLVKLLWLAYYSHTEPPSRMHQLPKNTLVLPAAFSSAFSNTENAYSDYSRDLLDPESKPNRNFVRVLDGYGKMTRMVTHEYWSGIAWLGPLPLVRTMKDRVQAYRKYPIDGIYSETHPSWGPQGMTLYFFTRLLWNPDLDIEKEIDLYCKNYYGPAYAPMRKYHALLENAAHAGNPFYSYGIKTHQIFTADVMQQMGELMDQAKVLLGDQQPYGQRFQGVWAGYQYVRLVIPYFSFLEKGDLLEAAKAWERAKKLILSYKDGDVFLTSIVGSQDLFGNYNLNIPADIQKQAKEIVAAENLEKYF